MLISRFTPHRQRLWLSGIAVLLFCALLARSAGAAEGPGSVFIEDMTWRELAQKIQSGSTTVLVPIGGTEQNGPDMALGKHNVRARLLAERIAQELGDAVVAPVMSYVPEGDPKRDTGHLHFAGTLSVPSDAFVAELEGCAESLYLHGVRYVVFLGDHGGYMAEMHRAAKMLNGQYRASGAKAIALDAYYRASSEGFDAILKKHGFSDAEIGSHAGLADTSLTLALAPQLVRADRLAADGKGGVTVGLHGDPSRASAELGQRGVDLIVSESVRAIRAERQSSEMK
jgi:creatinine amidohydrolase/Fe(II)-dependent formamide hydrolase-like protein